MKKFLLITVISYFNPVAKLHAQVGIGTATPNAAGLLHVDVGTSPTKGLLVTGTYSVSASVPSLGAGTRLMFYPGKAAFRAGFAGGTEWDDANVGQYSIAMGFTTKAFGDYSVAMGYNTSAISKWSTAIGTGTLANNSYATSIGAYNTANGWSSTALGTNTKANGDYSVSMGYYTIATGMQSTAMGNNTSAGGNASTSMGYNTIASVDYSTAMGYKALASGVASVSIGNTTTASGPNSLALGYNTTASGASATASGNTTTASGINSTSMGYNTTASGAGSTAIGSSVSTNGQTGAFTIGDNDPGAEGVTRSGINDQFVARFWNGYYFLTSGDATRSGVMISHNGNSWLSICDKNRKENFEQISGEEILQKISTICFTSWNYKMQDPKTYRHYGIMAQDFNKAFGKDKYGTIGNDTTVNPIDMIGIDMAAIQALEKRTNELKNEDAILNEKLSELTELRKENEHLKQSVAQLQTSINEQEKLITLSLKKMEVISIKQKAK